MSDLDPEVLRLLRERFAWQDAQPEDGGLRARAPLPDLGALVNYVPPEQRADYFRFWVYDVLDEALLAQFPEDALYPDKTPPSLRFVNAALERHKENPRSPAYLFCLNLLVIYALGWRPDLPTQPMRPLMAGEGAADQPWAQEAREHLTEHVLADKIRRVARDAYARHARGRLRDIELQDAEQQAKRYATSLIAGESIDDMAHAVTGGRADESDEARRPFEVRILRHLDEEYRRRKVALEPHWPPGSEQYERFRLARGLIIGYLLGIQDALEAGERARIKSFWPHGEANLVTHLFGRSGGRGRLYQELRDWLQREAKRQPDARSLSELGEVASSLEDVEGVCQQVLDAPPEDSGRRRSRSITKSSNKPSVELDADTFRQIDWSAALGRAANALNLAILEGTWVERLEGRQLRVYLIERGGIDLPSAAALRQRRRFLRSRVESYLRQKYEA